MAERVVGTGSFGVVFQVIDIGLFIVLAITLGLLIGQCYTDVLFLSWVEINHNFYRPSAWKLVSKWQLKRCYRINDTKTGNSRSCAY